MKKKKFEHKNFKKKLYNPKFIFPHDFKHQKWKLHEGLTVLTPSQTWQRAFKVAVGWFNPHPTLFRVREQALISEKGGTLRNFHLLAGFNKKTEWKIYKILIRRQIAISCSKLLSPESLFILFWRYWTHLITFCPYFVWRGSITSVLRLSQCFSKLKVSNSCVLW